ncbi:hypothetical protein DU002_01330 [Corallincola holothuriorum]|uniref:Glycosyl transferase family 28 C-terminal domain-containing protein n=1 Tax=Corallincola holothuriorum TaxID=2282215 RepID=A0A368NTV2_9GAMM|nr:glycosyltransferase [Corallincola holothuriorum]RCU52641.1 hypothetical protein DU002_01330 [Corallincola holothuriorum]
MSNTIALCWELGGGLGHVTGLKMLADRLIQSGVQVILVVKTPHDLLSFKSCPPAQLTPIVLQAPRWRQTSPSSNSGQRFTEKPITNYAATLLAAGYHDGKQLQQHCDDWQALLKQHQVSLVVADHAPTARIAAHLLSIPHIGIGTGFCCPPKQTPFPAFDMAPDVDDNARIVADQALTQQINQVLQAAGASQVTNAQQILCSDNDVLNTLPHMDHYQRQNQDGYWGPLFSQQLGTQNQIGNSDNTEVPSAAHSKTKKRLLCYLKAGYPNISALVWALVNSDAEKLVYMNDNGELANILRNDPLTQFSQTPIDINTELGAADLVICHGGHNLSAQTLLAGVPLLMLPEHMEQGVLANKLQQQGLALACDTKRTTEEYQTMINKGLTDPQLTANSQAFANHYRGYDSDEMADEMSEMFLEIIKGQ